MKILCDVCEKEEATKYCSADEAALCESCDQRVHHANKLATKHSRLSLLPPSLKQSPLCDICQERRAFLFCQEDRAILCRECDHPIHTANEHTQKHNRFLLTGVKLGAAADQSQTLNISAQSSTKRPKTAADSNGSIQSCATSINNNNINEKMAEICENGWSYSTTSSISEYLMETLPGWQLDDFLDPSNGFCKPNGLYGFDDLGRSTCSFSQVEDLGFRVPDQVGVFDDAKDQDMAYPMTFKFDQNWGHNSFTVPQISPPSSKKTRHFR